MKLVRLLPLAVALTWALGCGKSPNTLPVANVSGTVSVDGKPLEKGSVTFETPGFPPKILSVSDGKYSGAVNTGQNRVVVSAPRPLAAANKMSKEDKQRMESSGLPLTEESLPPEWNTASKETRVVEAGGANAFDFDIKTKK